jgi:hypothetical protein
MSSSLQNDYFNVIVDLVYPCDKKSAIMLVLMKCCIEKRSNVNPTDLNEIHDQLLPLVDKFATRLAAKDAEDEMFTKQSPVAVPAFNEYNFCMKPTEL